MELASIILQVILMLLIDKCQSASPYSPFSQYNQQFCTDTHTGRQLYVGEIFTRTDQCTRVQCLGTLQLWETSCPVPKAINGECRSVAPPLSNLDYPKCCPLFECRTYSSNPQGTMEQTNTYDHEGKLITSHITEMIVINKHRRLGPEAAIPQAGPIRKYGL